MTFQETIEGLPARITESIKALLGGADERVKTAEASAAKATADLSKAQTDLSTEQAAHIATKSLLATSEASLKTQTEKATKLESEAKTVAEKATELAAAQGIPAGSLPAGGVGVKSEDSKRNEAQVRYDKLLEEGKSLEAGRFYEENKKLFS